MNQQKNNKVLFVSWAENCSRSDNLARLLGGESKMIYAQRLGSHYMTIGLKYFLQSMETWQLLRKTKPNVIMVMVPPVFICIPVYLYCLASRAGYITDTHTAAFMMGRWKPLLFMNAWFYKRAITNIVTNAHLAEQVEAWQAPTTVIGDLPVQFEQISSFPLNGKFSIAVVCSFNSDEPLDNIWQAARELNDVAFYVTGKIKDAPPEYISSKPSNVHLTDFLPDDQYAGLIKACSAVMVLTTRDHTMQRGGYEAVALETPIITSDWPVLRETFRKGVIFVDNTPENIIKAVRELQASLPDFKTGIKEQRQERLKVWKNKEKKLRAAILSRLKR